jgi:DDE domain
VLVILVQPRHGQQAAERFLRQVIDGVGYQPRVVITDTLASYRPAIRRMLPNTEYRRHKRLNNRLRIHIGLCASVSGRCRASSRLSRRSDSLRPSARCAITSVRDGTVSPLSATRKIMRNRFQQWREIARLGTEPEAGASPSNSGLSGSCSDRSRQTTYHAPHRTLRLQTPYLKVGPTTGIARSRPVFNGLHHIYKRVA